MPLPAAAIALFNLLPTALKLFGQDKPAEIVEKAVSIAKVVTGETTPEAALESVQADPEKMAQYIKEGEERAITWFKLYLEDTQNARERDIKLRELGHKNTRANILVVIAFVLLAVCITVVVWMSDLNEYAKGIITLFVGRALGWIEQVFSFEFGTTRSSKQKDATIEKQAESLLK
jgi:hypothetical protein